MLSQVIKQFPNHTVKLQQKHYRSKYPCGVVLRHPRIFWVTSVIKGWDLYDIDRWVASNQPTTELIDGYKLEALRQLYHRLKKLKDHSTTHAGWNQLTVYFEKFDHLKKFVKWADSVSVTDLPNEPHWVVKITAVPDGQDTESCAATKFKDYEYKVFLKQLPATKEYIKQLRGIFTNIADQVHLTPAAEHMLHTDMYYTPNSYFYVKDQATLSYLYLTCPEIIRRAYKIHPVDKKCTNP